MFVLNLKIRMKYCYFKDSLAFELSLTLQNVKLIQILSLVIELNYLSTFYVLIAGVKVKTLIIDTYLFQMKVMST